MTTEFILSNEDDVIVLDGETTNYPNITFGESNDFEFYLTGESISGDFESTGGTWSGDTGFTWSGSTGGTWAGGGIDLTSASERYNRLKEYGKYAGYASTDRTLSSVYFSENADFERSDVNSLVVQIRPGSGVQEARGVWAILESMDDTTEIFGAIARINMSVFVLAEDDEYQTEQDVRDEFESDF